MNDIKKYIKDGKVAVAISPCYGGAWSSWEDKPDLKATLLFHPDIIQMILDGRRLEITNKWLIEHFGEEYKYVYVGGNKHLIVEWVAVGAKFRIHEYDGSERVVLYEDENWFIA